jgi:hypothetical protein
VSHRFRFSEGAAGDFDLPDVESVLDALEAALVVPDTPMFDAARQCWQPVARHPEVRAAWAERARFRPPGTGLDLPPLPPEEEVPAEGDESARRRAAYAMVIRGNRIPVEEPAPPEPGPRRSIAAGLILVVVLLLLVGLSVVQLAVGLVRVAATAVRGAAP